jgi:hypothetical protein
VKNILVTALLLVAALSQYAFAEEKAMAFTLAGGSGGFGGSPYFDNAKAVGMGGASAFDNNTLAFVFEQRTSPQWSFGVGFASLGYGGVPVFDPSPRQVSIFSNMLTWKYFPRPVDAPKKWDTETYVGGGVDGCNIRVRNGGREDTQDMAAIVLQIGGEVYVKENLGIVAEAKYEYMQWMATSLGDLYPSHYAVVVGVRYHFIQ